MQIVIDIPKEQYYKIVYIDYHKLRDIVRDGVVLEKCEDAISREAVINLINHSLCDLKRDADKQIFINTLNSLPSVTLRTNLAETSQDCISILNRIMEYTYGMLTAEKIGLQHLIKSMMDELADLPSVTPERPKGKWIEVFVETPNDPYRYGFKAHKCSKCEYRPFQISDYCPNCGAEMNGGDSE